MERSKNTVKRGRPQLYDYDSKNVLDSAVEIVVERYSETGQIKATAESLGLAPLKVKKLLITAEVLKYDETKTIQRLMSYNMSMEEIMEETGLSKASINSYLPYSKIPYKQEVSSPNAKRCERYREKKDNIKKKRS